MNRDVRDRILMPIAVPIGVLAVIGILVWSFSRILIAVGSAVAIAVALAASVDILLIAILVSGRKEGSSRMYIPLLGITAVALVGGGVYAAGRPPGPQGAEEKPGGAPAPTAFEIAAKNIQFDKQTITLTAAAPAAIAFRNEDQGIPHNVAIYTDEEAASSGGQALFKGEIFEGAATRTYRFTAPPAGSYYFHCDVHPAMKGTVEVVAGEAGGEPGGKPGGETGGSTGGVKVEARNIAFDTKELRLSSGGEAKIVFSNKDKGIPHNIAIYADRAAAESGSDALFRGETFPGVATRTYSFKAPPPGSYYFHCDVHPAMAGTVTVQ